MNDFLYQMPIQTQEHLEEKVKQFKQSGEDYEINFYSIIFAN